jgi:hypothetical protein
MSAKEKAPGVEVARGEAFMWNETTGESHGSTLKHERKL